MKTFKQVCEGTKWDVEKVLIVEILKQSCGVGNLQDVLIPAYALGMLYALAQLPESTALELLASSSGEFKNLLEMLMKETGDEQGERKVTDIPGVFTKAFGNGFGTESST